MDILTILLTIIVLILFPLGQIFRIDIGSGVALNPLDIGVFFCALIAAYTAVRRKRFPSYAKAIAFFVLFGGVGLLVSIRQLLTSQLVVSFLYLIRFLCYASIALGVSLLAENKKKFLLNIMLVSGGLVLAAGFVQYFFYTSLYGVLYEGWDPHLYRMFSTFLDPNFSGPFFVFYFLLVLYFWFEQKHLQRRILFGILGVLTVVAVALSFSRGAYVDFIVGAAVFLFLKGYRKTAIGIPVMIVMLALLFTLFIPYGEGKNLLRTASTQARLISAENAVIIFLKNPLVGVGFDSYRYAQYRYHLLGGFNWQDTHSGAGTDNSFLFVLATTGIFGGIAYGWFWYIVIKRSVGQVKKKQVGAIFLFSSFIALLVSGVVENTLFYPSIMVWLFLLIGFIG